MDTIEELFGLAELLGKQPRPAGPRLAIVTNGGGPGVLATDALIECGGKLAELSSETFDKLNKLLPATLEPWKPDRYSRRRECGNVCQGGRNRDARRK